MEYHNTLRESFNETNIDSFKSLNKLTNNEEVEIGEIISGYKNIEDKIIHDIYWTIVGFYKTLSKNENKYWFYDFETLDTVEEDSKVIGNNRLEIINHNAIIEFTWRYIPVGDNPNEIFINYNLIYVADNYIFPLICFNGNYDKVFHFNQSYVGDNPKLISGYLTDDSFEIFSYFIDNFNSFSTPIIEKTE
jgi:hypothetical protein